MGFRTVVIKSRAKLDYKMDYLVVRTDEQVNRIHLDEIALLIVESTAVSLTAYLLAEMTRKKIKVIFCDERRNPSAEVCSMYGAHDTSRKVREQIRWGADIKDIVWAEIVRAKIEGQISNLPDYVVEQRTLMGSYINEIKPADVTNREAHAAKVYFNALFGMDFSRAADNNINAALNYGYGILLSAFNREITAQGYITQLGIFHDNVFNHFNLSSDLMEPFRPFVDRIVKDMSLEKFEHSEKMSIVDVLNISVNIANQKQFLGNAIRLYCLSIFDALSDNDIAKIKFPSYEL